MSTEIIFSGIMAFVASALVLIFEYFVVIPYRERIKSRGTDVKRGKPSYFKSLLNQFRQRGLETLRLTGSYWILITLTISAFKIIEGQYPIFIHWLVENNILNGVYFPDFMGKLGYGYDFMYSFIGWFSVVYGFITPLILIRVWEQFDVISNVFEREADAVKIFFENSLLLPDYFTESKKEIFSTLVKYVKHVCLNTSKEVYSQENRIEGNKILTETRMLFYSIIHQGETSITSTLIKNLDNIIDLRGDRISLTKQSLFRSLRFVPIITSIIWILPFYFVTNIQEQGIMASLLTIGVTFLVIFILTLIEDLDDPFHGSFRVNMDIWLALEQDLLSSLGIQSSES